MNKPIEIIRPDEIESSSFKIIESELPHPIAPELAPIIKRVVHTTADFDYVDNLCFSEKLVSHAIAALLNRTDIVTDTNMAKAGINQSLLSKLGINVHCFIADGDVAEKAKEQGCTRAAISMEKAAAINRPLIFAIGNAPTALIKLHELISCGSLIQPALIIAAPVGFVNVVYSKELIMDLEIPYIVARGRKGGSSVAAAICNALLKICIEEKTKCTTK